MCLECALDEYCSGLDVLVKKIINTNQLNNQCALFCFYIPNNKNDNNKMQSY